MNKASTPLAPSSRAFGLSDTHIQDEMEHNTGFRNAGQEADHAHSVTYLFVVVAYI